MADSDNTPTRLTAAPTGLRKTELVALVAGLMTLNAPSTSCCRPWRRSRRQPGLRPKAAHRATSIYLVTVVRLFIDSGRVARPSQKK